MSDETPKMSAILLSAADSMRTSRVRKWRDGCVSALSTLRDAADRDTFAMGVASVCEAVEVYEWHATHEWTGNGGMCRKCGAMRDTRESYRQCGS